MSFPLDQPVRLNLRTYSDAAETTLADATAVSLDILNPDGTTTTVTLAATQVIRDSTGVYHYDLTPTTAGHYAFHWKATGTVATSQDGSFDVEPEYGRTIVSVDEFALYLNNDGLDQTRAKFILGLAQTLCESIVTPLPAGAEAVILDVAERAFANPTNVGGNDLGLYSEGVGGFSTSAPGVSGGGLWLTQENKATLRRLSGSGGAFMIDTAPTTAGAGLPWWDTAAAFTSSTWDTPR